ncbi:unnamed protein product, partial [Musa hybrid cultivar]
ERLRVEEQRWRSQRWSTQKNDSSSAYSLHKVKAVSRCFSSRQRNALKELVGSCEHFFITNECIKIVG